MKRKFVFLTLFFVIVILVSVFATVETFNINVQTSNEKNKPFYAGIEFGYGNATDCKALIDKVKNYTNLIVISATSITTNEANLNDTCTYAYNAGMHIIIYFPQMNPISGSGGSFSPYIWAMKAKDTYGANFLGLYIYDEAGGEVLDHASGALSINYVNQPNSQQYPTTVDYKTASDNFVANANNQIKDFAYCAQKSGTSVMTADYGLYWWDYKAGYDTIFAELGWGNDRQLAIDLCRGAATAQDKDWGAIICWDCVRTGMAGSLENGSALYNDLTLAYDNGAEYAIVFDYAGNNMPNPYQFGILNDEHFAALQNFWTYVQQNPQKHGSIAADTALVLPEGYGFGFRNANDKIWGLDQADYWTAKIWNDTNNMVDQYGGRLDVVFSDPEFQAAIAKDYAKVIPWTSDANSNDYPVVDLNDTFGYATIQQALVTGATSSGDTILVKAGTYNGSITISKPVTLLGENKKTTTIDAKSMGSAVSITATFGVTVSGFTIKNGNNINTALIANNPAALAQFLQQYGITQSMLAQYNSTMLSSLMSNVNQAFGGSQSAGIYLLNADNCTLSGNIIEDSTYGILMSASANNTLNDNTLVDCKYGLGVLAQTLDDYVNYVDASNTVNGQPVYYWINKSNLAVPQDATSVTLVNCSSITVENLTLTGNGNGLTIVNTADSTIVGNAITNNYQGLTVANSSGNTFQNNIINSNVFNFNYTNNVQPNYIDTSNTINGKAICVWYNQQDKTVPPNAGYVALINCTRISVENLNLSGGQGILLQNCTYCTVDGNALANMTVGVQLSGCQNCNVTGNTITGSQDGIVLARFHRQQRHRQHSKQLP